MNPLWPLFGLLFGFPVLACGEAPHQVLQACSLIGGVANSSADLDVRAVVGAYNRQAIAIRSLHAEALMHIDSGKEFGVPAKLPDLPAFVDFLQPSFVRLSVPFPGTGIRGFELIGDGREFGLLVPGLGRRTYFIGPIDAPQESPHPTENLRPRTLLYALRWPEAMLPDNASAGTGFDNQALTLSIDLSPTLDGGRTAKIDFDRDRGTVRLVMIYDVAGHPLLETRYADWTQTRDTSAPEGVCFPGTIEMRQSGGPTGITLKILRLELNPQIPISFFRAIPPNGTPVVRLNAAKKLIHQ